MGYRSKQYSLKKIILLTIAGLSTASTLLTALLLHYNYDGKLLQEFQSKISTESHNVSLGLSNKLNQVTHQLKEISLDNSIRVTLMLEVDTQLEERLAAYQGYPENTEFFLWSSKSKNIAAATAPALIGFAQALINGEAGEGQAIRGDAGKFLIGYVQPIKRKGEMLGKGVAIYTFSDESINTRQFMAAPGTEVLISGKEDDFFLDSGEPAVLTQQEHAAPVRSYDAYHNTPADQLTHVQLNRQEGILLRLPSFSNLYYFAPKQELQQAQMESTFISLATGLFFICLSIIFAFWLTRRIVLPLQTISDMAKSLSEGKADTLIPHSSLTELHQFTRSLVEIMSNLKQAENKLRINEQRFRQLFESTDGIAVQGYDSQRKVIFWNSASEELYGYSANEAIGQQFEDLLLQSRQADPLLGRLIALQEKGESLPSGEQRLHHKNGEPIPVFSSQMLQYNVVGEPELFRIDIDIRQRIILEQTLIKTRDCLSALMDNIDSIVFVADLDTQSIIFINQYGMDVLGDVIGQCQGNPLQTTVEAPYACRKSLLEADGTPNGIHVWEQYVSDTGCWYECRDQAIQWLDGHLVRMQVATDITARKISEHKLLLSDAVFNTTSEGIMVLDSDFRIQTVNPAFSHITGFSDQEAKGMASPLLKAPEQHRSDQDKAIHHAMSGAGRWEGEVWSQRKNGESYPEWISINRAKNSHDSNDFYVVLFQDITTRKEADEKILYQANFDALTGLPNRNLFAQRLRQATLDAKEHNTDVALLFIGLGRFKRVNDSLGHNYGDMLLIEAAQRLRAAVKSNDTVGRLGGDEFSIILSDLRNPDKVQDIVEKILDSITRPYMLEDKKAYVAASIGITLHSSDGKDINTLMKNADTAMSIAKRQDNTYRFFTQDMDTEARLRHDLEIELRSALNTQQFVLHYQPIYDPFSGIQLSTEALVRWIHPEKGLIPPDQFIPLAEETQLIVPLGSQILFQACKDAANWPENEGIQPSVAVNISSQQLYRSDIIQTVKHALEISGLPPERLDLEITESVLLSDDTAVMDTLLAIRQLGVGISIDDFGTGYSSLSYLKKFPVTKLKIDRSFIADITKDTDDRTLVQAILAMAKGMGLTVVAEGVEDAEQLEFLREHRCDLVQGYFFSRPIPNEELHELLDLSFEISEVEDTEK
ncbi:bifunctional diguanylate cyclase/phosphodiesterase [Aliamphritea hakodatensis]|uniref:bifunctional diguanylate cyclase/phosphodiesterase n=1 Tax=Aliamphritea hakodatensis TaxID=2895352 RepID=UPI0022FD3D9E|nr:EAL domain-containing protein [Aliamphritea hakodatensis]